MCYAASNGSAAFVKHANYGWFQIRLNSQPEIIEVNNFEVMKSSLQTHGIAMWITWTILGALMVFSKRYIKFYYNLGHLIHASLGILIFVLTFIYGF